LIKTNQLNITKNININFFILLKIKMEQNSEGRSRFNLPVMPVATFIILPLFFIFLILFTNIRYQMIPSEYISHVAVFASLVVGFIFLYSMQKFDQMNANVPVVERNIIGLSRLADKYNPSLNCYLIEYILNFLTFTNDKFPITTFEMKIVPLISNQEEIFRLKESVTTLEEIENQRISRVNLIPEPIWYVVLVSVIILTIIFCLDTTLERKTDAILSIILIWFPIFVIYFMYNFELNALEETMDNLLKYLHKKNKKHDIKCNPSIYETINC